MIERIGKIIQSVAISENEADSNGEPANVVDGLFAIARALDRVADSIHQLNKDQKK